MLKEYIRRPGEVAASQVVIHADAASEEREAIDQTNVTTETVPKLKNSDVLKNLQKEKLSHLTTKEQNEMMELVFQFVGLFPDTPTRTDCVFHDVEVGNATPIKQHPYQVNPLKLEVM